MKPILLAGEIFRPPAAPGESAEPVNGAAGFIDALAREGIAVVQLGAEECAAGFPSGPEGFAPYGAVVLSDIDALTLLLTPQARAGQPGLDRLEALRAWVAAGGGLMMAGGYMSFTGMRGEALFHGTAVEDCLPVACLPGPDGLEAPAGMIPEPCGGAHPILPDPAGALPPVLGLNRVTLRDAPGTRELLACTLRGRRHPLLAVRDYERGRSLAWTTDIGPHWLSAPFLAWSGYGPLMARMLRWLAREI